MSKSSSSSAPAESRSSYTQARVEIDLIRRAVALTGLFDEISLAARSGLRQVHSYVDARDADEIHNALMALGVNYVDIDTTCLTDDDIEDDDGYLGMYAIIVKW